MSAPARGPSSPRTRLDGPAKVTGAARYAADQHQPGQLHAVLVGGHVPAGILRSLDTAEALAVPGVVRVLTTGDLPAPHSAFTRLTVPPLATRLIPLQEPAIAYEGQPVAIVLAETLEAAEQAAALVHAHIEPGPVTLPDQAPAVAPSTAEGYAQLAPLENAIGDLDAALASAHTVVDETYTQPSRHVNPMEPSAILAVWNADELTVYDSVQHVFAVQEALAAVFGLDPAGVRVVAPHTGGGFGAKAFIWPHEILAAMAARVVGRPVKLVLTRAQMYSLVGYQPKMTQRVRLAADGDGRVSGIGHDVENTTSLTEDYVEFGSLPSGSLYANTSLRTSQRVRRGNVNLPTFLRSPIDGPGTWALGSAMDELAHRLGVDPLDLRVRNHADAEMSTGRRWSSKQLLAAYEEGARRFGWYERPRGGTRDGHWNLGFGMADATQGQFRFPARARVRLDVAGRVTLECGFTDIGQGSTTVFPQILADALGIAPEEVVLRHGDSALPFAGPTYGSGTTIGVGAAVLDAATALRTCLLEILGWPPAEVSWRDGTITRGSVRIALGEAVRRAGVGDLVAEGSFELPGGAPADAGPEEVATRTFGAVFAEVGVDRDLGLLRLRRVTAVYSVGRVMNGRTARSQMIGGIVWGWGMAAMEASHTDPVLGRWLAQDLAGVALPVNADIPADIDVSFIDETDYAAGPLGAKGIGELAATGVAAAVANAVHDAIGVRIRSLPITPAKLVTPWRRS